MGLYRNTVWKRATVSTDPQVVVEPDPTAPRASYRKVTLCIRDSPEIEITIDGSLQIDARDSYWPNPPTNKTLCICLRPEQHIAARSVGELHELSVIIEHWEG